MSGSHYKHADVLKYEREEINKQRPDAEAPVIGVCLSGGGIRSASFSVGALQGLAQFGVLDQLDYLSTVSGGGYAGAWLSAWLARKSKDEVFAQLASKFEPEPIRHLRLHSTYLSEEVSGMGGTMMWSLTYLWNLFLYWWIVLGALGSALMLPAIYAGMSNWKPASGIPLWVAAGAAVFVSIYVVLDHPGFRDDHLSLSYFFVLVPGAVGIFGYSAALFRFWPLPSTNALVVAGLIFLVAAVIIGVLVRLEQRPDWLKGLILETPKGADPAVAGSHQVKPIVVTILFYLTTSLILAALRFPLIGRLGQFDAPGFPDRLTQALTPEIAVAMLFIALFLVLTFVADNSALEHDWLNTAGVFVGATILWMLISTTVVVLAGGALNAKTCAICAVTTLILTHMLDVNQLSLHTAYRHRLVAAYLAASHEGRQPHPLIGLDAGDDLPFSNLPCRPLLLLNMTAQTHGGRNCEPFTVTSQFAGNESLGYRETKLYAGGMSTGTAIAVSGAAIDPDVGSVRPIARFLMKLLNARLGVWVPSPGKESKIWDRLRFGTALRSLVHDIIGIPMPSDKFIKLSDGGHFDNLGLLAMVERKPDLILILDASEDSEYFYGALGAAMQRADSDLRARIELKIEISKCDHRPHTTVGTITYRDGKKGVIAYVKPALTGDEPADVRMYAASNPRFPHEPTVQQLFSEWQFESYRKLGRHSIDAAYGDLLEALIDNPLPIAVRIRAQLIQARQMRKQGNGSARPAEMVAGNAG